MAKVSIEIETTEENKRHIELLFGEAPAEKGKTITVELEHPLDSQAVSLLLTAVSNLGFSRSEKKPASEPVKVAKK